MEMNRDVKIAVIGAGSWGTAIAVLLSKKWCCVSLWGHNADHVSEISKQRENRKYLPSIQLPDNIEVTSDLESCLRGSKVVVMVVPSHGLRDVFSSLVPYVTDDMKIISAVKGVENVTLLTMTQVIQELLQHQNRHNVQVGVLSGPSFAEEVACGVPTAVTIGFFNQETAKEMQGVFGSEVFRVYASMDVMGLEISGSYKNIIAIAAGVCEGLGYGLNTRAALITRGLAEMKRLGVTLGAEPETFSGLSGLGDLVLTCTGDLSRNRTVGLKLGKGKKINQSDYF